MVEDVERQRLPQLVGVGRPSAAVEEVHVRVEDGQQAALQRGERAAGLGLAAVGGGRGLAPLLKEVGVHAERLLDALLWADSRREGDSPAWPPQEGAGQAVQLLAPPLGRRALLLERLCVRLVQLHVLEILHERILFAMLILKAFVIAVLGIFGLLGSVQTKFFQSSRAISVIVLILFIFLFGTIIFFVLSLHLIILIFFFLLIFIFFVSIVCFFSVVSILVIFTIIWFFGIDLDLNIFPQDSK